MAKALAFYRALGLAVPAGADDEPHVEVELGGGMRLLFDTEETIRSFHPAWSRRRGGGADRRWPFALAGRRGGRRRLRRADRGRRTTASWSRSTRSGGSATPCVHDPDGNGVDLFAPLAR